MTFAVYCITGVSWLAALAFRVRGLRRDARNFFLFGLAYALVAYLTWPR